MAAKEKHLSANVVANGQRRGRIKMATLPWNEGAKALDPARGARAHPGQGPWWFRVMRKRGRHEGLQVGFLTCLQYLTLWLLSYPSVATDSVLIRVGLLAVGVATGGTWGSGERGNGKRVVRLR